MKLYAINKDYINYLKKFDGRVPDVDYGTFALKPFIRTGVYTEYGAEYYAPLTSMKDWMSSKNNTLTLTKLYDKAGEPIGAINCRFMIPVPQEMSIELTRANLSMFRNFHTEDEKWKLWGLLKEQMKALENKEGIIRNNTLKLRRAALDKDEKFRKCYLDLSVLEDCGWIFMESMNMKEKINYGIYGKINRSTYYDLKEEDNCYLYTFNCAYSNVRIDNDIFDNVYNEIGKQPDAKGFHILVLLDKDNPNPKEAAVSAYYKKSENELIEIRPWIDKRVI